MVLPHCPPLSPDREFEADIFSAGHYLAWSGHFVTCFSVRGLAIVRAISAQVQNERASLVFYLNSVTAGSAKKPGASPRAMVSDIVLEIRKRAGDVRQDGEYCGLFELTVWAALKELKVPCSFGTSVVNVH